MAKKVINVSRPRPLTLKVKVWKKAGKRLQEPSVRTVRAPKIRRSLTPGTVVILLAGPYRGRRVVLLKALPSGLLATTGPYKLNRIPLRRISPRYVIATSTKLNLPSSDVINKLSDEYFSRTHEEKNAHKRSKKNRKKVGGGEGDSSIFMAENSDAKKKTSEVLESRKKEQTVVDDVILKVIKEHKEAPMLEHYLKSRFYLQQGDRPHLMKF